MSNTGITNNSPQKKLKNVYVLSYDGVVTGSQELRCYNFDVVSKQYKNYKGALIDYYDKYDNHPAGKSNEPFFDGFLAHMAFFNTGDKSNKTNYGLENINYYEIDYVDSQEENKNWNSKLMTTRVNPFKKIENFREKTNYNEGEHIFLLCPTSTEVYDEIRYILDDRVERQILTPLFIHIQGEAINSNEISEEKPIPRDSGKCPDTGMTGSGGGLFGEAFNLFSGGLEIQKLRRKLTDMDAQTYSVKPDCKDKTETQALTSNTDKCKLKGEYKLPTYYIQANKDILGFSDTEQVDETLGEGKFLNLNIKKVFQDITDKDNLASLAIIGRLKQQKESIPLMLVGFRIYESNSIPFGRPDVASTLNFFPPPLNIRQNPITYDWEKPGDIDNETQRGKYGNINYLDGETINFYTQSTEGFMRVLESILPKTFIMEYGGIADGRGKASISLRSPFNMSLYFFAPETYMDVGVGQNNGKLIKGVKRQQIYSSHRGGLCKTDDDCVDQNNICKIKEGMTEGQCEYISGGRKLKKKTLRKKSNLKCGKKHKNNSKKKKFNKISKKTKNNKKQKKNKKTNKRN